MNAGWIKIDRKIFNNPFLCKSNYLAIWIYILINVAYEEKEVFFDGKKIKLKPGQGIFSLSQIANFWGVSQSGVEKILKRFETEKQIEQQKTFHGRLITAVNWSKYQKLNKQKEKQSASRVQAECKQSGNLPLYKEDQENKEGKKEKISSENQNFLDYFQDNIHPWVSKTEMEAVAAMSEEFSFDDFKAAVDKAKENKVTNTFAWRYIQTILSTGGVKDFSKRSKNDPVAGYEGAQKILESGELDGSFDR